MVFAPETGVALKTVVNLINSAANGAEKLATVEDLVLFFTAEGLEGDRGLDASALADVQALRSELSDLYRSNQEGVVQGVNKLLQDARALPQLVKHDHWDWHLHGTPTGAPLVKRLGAEAGMALVDVVRTGELDRLKVCAAQTCDAVVLDLSRNKSKRYCETGNCANRAHVAAYRRRRAGGS